MKPEEELKRLNKLIRQFESVRKSTTDPFQEERVSKQLKKLKAYKEKVETFHVINKDEVNEILEYDEFQNFPFLKGFVERDEGEKEIRQFDDREVFHLSLYLSFFEREFLALLSEIKLKLDFKHSMERDSFYHRFEKIRRQLYDFKDDTLALGQYEGKHEEDMHKRSFKLKRNLTLEADRFFRHLIKFTSELIKDIERKGLKCLNSQEKIQFDKIEESSYIAGILVAQALIELNTFSKELVSYLNVPQIELQEK